MKISCSIEIQNCRKKREKAQKRNFNCVDEIVSASCVSSRFLAALHIRGNSKGVHSVTGKTAAP
jgi:hypothetical protein